MTNDQNQPASPQAAQLLQHAQSHRAAIQASFEAQRVALTEALEVQKRSLAESVQHARKIAAERPRMNLPDALPTEDAALPHGAADAALNTALEDLLANLLPPAINAEFRKTGALERFSNALHELVREEVRQQLANQPPGPR